MSYSNYMNYANKSVPYWMERQIPDMFLPDPRDFPNQRTGLYFNYHTNYREVYNPNREIYNEAILKEIEEDYYYRPTWSDNSDFEDDYYD